MEDEGAGAQDVARLQAELDTAHGRIASMERDAAAEQERLLAELAAATDAVAAFEADIAATAVSNGLRANASAMPVARRTFVVTAAAAASGMNGGP